MDIGNNISATGTWFGSLSLSKFNPAQASRAVGSAVFSGVK